MTNLVTIENNQLEVLIKDVISFSGNKYESIRDNISRNKEKFIELGFSFAKDMTDFKSAVFEDNLKLNEEQTTFLFILMDNTPQIVEFKFNLVKQFYIQKDFLCEVNRKQIQSKDTQLQIAQKNLTEAKRKIHAYPRNNGFEPITRIIQDNSVNITPYDLNKILVEVGMLTLEVININQYKSLQMSGNIPLLHVDTVLSIIDKRNIERGVGFVDTHPMLDNF